MVRFRRKEQELSSTAKSGNMSSNQLKIATVGLGYVGLPLTLALGRAFQDTVGFDLSEKKVNALLAGDDPTDEGLESEIRESSVEFTVDPSKLADRDVIIVAVPTPIDENRQPDLTPLVSASKTVAANLKRGAIIVFESTVYPGCTEDDCLPILEELSGLKMGVDFKLGYSPERINPGDKEHTITKIIKVVSGCDAEALDIIARTYEIIVEAGTYRASSIKVAEAAKIIENTQRDVNIALMNELSCIFDKMGINTYEVLAAAGTKWNFLKFFPGLVGGHCIGVDPYYLTYKASELGFKPEVILAGRKINDSMGAIISKESVTNSKNSL
jgi:UDP-N-acetyl-D-galactosamine dehydrogenase